MKLYYLPMTRSTRPRWLLEELGVPYELVRLQPGEHRGEEYRKLNPLGQVPTLADGDLVLHESAAILLHLADKFPDKGFAPPVGSPERGTYYQWMIFGMATVEPIMVTLSEQNRRPEAQRDQQTVEATRARWRDVAAVLDRAVDGKEFLVGGRMSAADVLIASLLGWARMLGLLDDQPRLLEYSKRLAARPAAKASRAN